MPWLREGNCVFKKNSDGSKGEKEGCSESPAAAKRYMRALYANAETSASKEKADESKMTAIFPLDGNADIARIQEIVRGLVPDADFINPEDFHITAVYVNDGNLDVLKEEFSYSYGFNVIALVADYIGYFETPDGFAIYIGVRWNEDLRYMQSRLFQALAGSGNMVSSYSIPDWWTPHITLAYSATPIKPFNITPFAVLVNSVEVSDTNHDPIIALELKSDSLEFKSLDLEIVCKGVDFNAEGDLIIPVMGCPFTGPVKGVADYQGDFFHKGTEFGDASEVLLFWDHGREERYLIKELKAQGLDDDEIRALGPDFGFGKRDIGVAVKGAETEEGIIYNIIVNRNTKYIHALAKAARERKIGASGEYKYFEYDKDVPGKVDYAPLVGMALTPSPFNTDAVVLKSVTDPLEGDMAEKVKDKSEAVVPAEGEAQNKPTVTPVEEKKPTLTESLQQKSAELDKEAEKVEETVSLSAFQAVQAEVSQLKSVIENQDQKIDSFIDDLKTALPELANMIAKAMRIEIGESVQKSRLEFRSEDLFGKSNSRVEKSAENGTYRHAQSGTLRGYPGGQN